MDDEHDEPFDPPPSAGRWAVALGLAAIALGAGWLVSREHPDQAEPLAPPIMTRRAAPPAAAPPSLTPAAAAAVPSGSGASARSAKVMPPVGAPAATAPAGPILRVTSDVAGAFVFLDRKYLGTTPFESREVPTGSHQLNVSAAGHDGVERPVEIAADAPTEVRVLLNAVTLDANVAVVHKHAMGSCEGRLVATPAGLRYETEARADAFTVPFAALEAFDVDYLKKTLRVKVRGGRTWNFTTRGESADPLLVFQRQVDKARARLRTSSP